MNQLDNVDDGHKQARQPTKRKTPYKPKRACNQIVALTMLAVAASPFPSCQQVREIKVYPKGTNQLWLMEEDLAWLVESVAYEVAIGGVAEETAQPAHAISPTANCAVPGVHIRWDFQSTDMWEAIFFSGPRQGQTVRSKITSLSVVKWNKVRDHFAPQTTFEDATPEQKKTAVWHYLEMYCKELTENDTA